MTIQFWRLKIIMMVLWRFRINTPEYYEKITRCDTRKGREYEYVFFTIV